MLEVIGNTILMFCIIGGGVLFTWVNVNYKPESSDHVHVEEDSN